MQNSGSVSYLIFMNLQRTFTMLKDYTGTLVSFSQILRVLNCGWLLTGFITDSNQCTVNAFRSPRNYRSVIDNSEESVEIIKVLYTLCTLCLNLFLFMCHGWAKFSVCMCPWLLTLPFRLLVDSGWYIQAAPYQPSDIIGDPLHHHGNSNLHLSFTHIVCCTQHC